MQPQSGVMVTAQVRASKLESLRTLLATMNQGPGLADPDNELIPFRQFRQLHLARFVIIESGVNEDIREHGQEPREWPPTLVFIADVDGHRQPFLAELAVRAGPGLTRIFSHCEDFNPSLETLLAWMTRKNVKPAASYVNWVGRTVSQIKEEAELHRALRQKLDELQSSDATDKPENIHGVLRAHVESEREQGTIHLSPEPKTPFRWWLGNKLHAVLPPLILLLLTPPAVLLLPFFLVRLRMLERRDPEILPRPDRARVNQLARLEDQLVTNQFSAFGDVKPGLFRRYTLLLLLFALDYASRHIYKRGYLTRVQTIHFARWVLLDNKRRLLFASNYDGSLESYMDDFINKVAWGLNLVFSNGVGYPRTRWLIKGGAEQEQKFKYFLRRHQVYTDVWYKAYPDLTAHELARNTRIREGLVRKRFRNAEEISDWLALI